jgi:hypothetical protein
MTEIHSTPQASPANDVERLRQTLLPVAQQTPLLNKVITAISTGEDFSDLAALHAGAVVEQVVLLGPSGLYEAEASAILAYPNIVALYGRLLDRLGISPSAPSAAPAIGPPG